MSSTLLSPIDSREVVRCDNLLCRLVQFKTANNFCRKCRKSLEPEPVQEIVTAPPIVETMMESSQSIPIARTMKRYRQQAGLSQRQLAIRMGVPRTYVSKIENEKSLPTIASLWRIAGALSITMSDLIGQRDSEIRELMADPFLLELAQFTSRLNAAQMSNVLGYVQERLT